MHWCDPRRVSHDVVKPSDKERSKEVLDEIGPDPVRAPRLQVRNEPMEISEQVSVIFFVSNPQLAPQSAWWTGRRGVPVAARRRVPNRVPLVKPLPRQVRRAEDKSHLDRVGGVLADHCPKRRAYRAESQQP